jgi:hypothetical protein
MHNCHIFRKINDLFSSVSSVNRNDKSVHKKPSSYRPTTTTPASKRCKGKVKRSYFNLNTANRVFFNNRIPVIS